MPLRVGILDDEPVWLKYVNDSIENDAERQNIEIETELVLQRS